MNPKDRLLFLFSLEKLLAVLINEESSRYNNGVHTKHKHTDYHRFFYARIKPNETVLDIGSGNGFLAYDIADKSGALVTAIEISKGNYETAVKKFSHPNINYINGDALKDLPSRTFDTVVISNVLEHIEKRIEFMKAIQKNNNPKRWLIRVPMYDRDWRVPLIDELGMDSRCDNTHFIEYTEKSFDQELALAGLKPIYKEIHWGEIWCEATPI